jgi:hypothetical protein
LSIATGSVTTTRGTLGKSLCHGFQFLLVEHAILVGIATLDHASHSLGDFLGIQLAVLVLVVGQHPLDELFWAEATLGSRLGLSWTTISSWLSRTITGATPTASCRLSWSSASTPASTGSRLSTSRTELWHDLLAGKLAILVAVKFLQCSGCILDFLGRDLAILVRVQGGDDR